MGNTILEQRTKLEIEKKFENPRPETWKFVVQKKDETGIGIVSGELHSDYGGFLEIGFNIVPDERGKGYCSEAIEIMVDYLLLSKTLDRIQARTDIRNLSAQRVLEKTGFKKEGQLRKAAFIRGAGETCSSTVFSEKNGEGQRYLQKQ